MNSSEHICRIMIIIISAFTGMSSANKTVSTTICRVLIKLHRYYNMPAEKILTKMFAVKKALKALSALSVKAITESTMPWS